MDTITLAGGCYWCTEAIFNSLKGVVRVEPGYSGGDKPNPSYYDVASGTTGHAESIQITFDPKTISLEALLEVFYKLHDPTQINRQGADIGPQYRSAVFYSSESQKKKALEALENAQKNYKNKVVTEIIPFKNFYKAPPQHKNYYLKNKDNVYCKLVIDPKIDKLKKEFPTKIKKQTTRR
jgi:peptide-methionine (S)-S-oxide reductase